MKFEIRNRWTQDVQFTAEINCAEDAPIGVKVGLAVKWAFETGAYLRGADLTGADLRRADLMGADLMGADLRDADLRDADLMDADLTDADLMGADLTGADLRDADLMDADLTDADLTDADLTGADLTGADLRDIKNDFFNVLLHAIHEVDVLAAALREGHVDGSTYQGECACLVGTIANVKGCNYEDIYGLAPDSNRPAERWFMGIAKGDTPETNPVSRVTLEWINEFKKLIAAAKA